MKRRPTERTVGGAFEVVMNIGLSLPDVEATTKYDGSPVLKVGGSFMAGLATHPSAEPDTLVVRHGLEEREWLMDDAPETYYLTDYYRRYPLLLVRQRLLYIRQGDACAVGSTKAFGCDWALSFCA